MTKRIAHWAVGVTTAPRPTATRNQTLESLAAAGWPDTLVFHDEGKRLGAWNNWLRAVRGLLEAVRSADALLVVQDDAVLCRGLRAYLDHTLWPEGGAAICSPYCPGVYRAPRPGWHRQDRGWALVGAVCWAMPRAAAEAILHDLGTVVATHRIDARVGRWAAERKQRVWYHWPSLVQHEGIGNSALGDTGVGAIRQATHFVGTDFRAGKDPWP